MNQSTRIHGGPDSSGPVRDDFSSNANSAGPSTLVADLIKAADLKHYPDPAYLTLRLQLAALHAVSPERIVIAGSASEFIFRISSFVKQRSVRIELGPEFRENCLVWIPEHAYGEYASAASAWGLGRTRSISEASLLWFCEPSSPLGQSIADLHLTAQALDAKQFAVLDCAYEPLRLEGHRVISATQLDKFWQMYTPNKALGLTGVRGAYAVAPVGSEEVVEALNTLAPSWVMGADGVAMLCAWTRSDVQVWLKESLSQLRDWKSQQLALCSDLGWQTMDSVSNFYCATHPLYKPAEYLPVLRRYEIKLRDAASFGLPDHVRMAVLSPEAQDRFRHAWNCFVRSV